MNFGTGTVPVTKALLLLFGVIVLHTVGVTLIVAKVPIDFVVGCRVVFITVGVAEGNAVVVVAIDVALVVITVVVAFNVAFFVSFVELFVATTVVGTGVEPRIISPSLVIPIPAFCINAVFGIVAVD